MAQLRATVPSQGRRPWSASSSPAWSQRERNTSETTSSKSSRLAVPPRTRQTVTPT